YGYPRDGSHACMNVVTARRGRPGAELVRDIERAGGVGLMRRRRRTAAARSLGSGPGRLTQAMGITLAHNRADLVSGSLYLARGPRRRETIAATPRIGISQATDRRWRFVLRGSRFLSRPVR